MKTTTINTNQNSSHMSKLAPSSISKFLMLSSIFLFLGLSSFSKTVSLSEMQKEKETSSIRKQLYSQIDFPSFMKDDHSLNESVNVMFQVDSTGSIKVIKTDSANETLNKFIVAEMEKAKLESLDVNEENVYKINIHFKLL